MYPAQYIYLYEVADIYMFTTGKGRKIKQL